MNQPVTQAQADAAIMTLVAHCAAQKAPLTEVNHHLAGIPVYVVVAIGEPFTDMLRLSVPAMTQVMEQKGYQARVKTSNDNN